MIWNVKNDKPIVYSGPVLAVFGQIINAEEYIKKYEMYELKCSFSGALIYVDNLKLHMIIRNEKTGNDVLINDDDIPRLLNKDTEHFLWEIHEFSI